MGAYDGCNAGAVAFASLVVIEPFAFGLLEQTGEVELHQPFMTTRERYFQAFETGEGRRPVGS